MSRKKVRSLKLWVLMILFVTVATLGVLTSLSERASAQASATKIRAASFIPSTQTDFSSQDFKQSVGKFKAAGGTHVSFVIPWYQTVKTGHDIGRGHNTPTDASLIEGINYVHSLGLKTIFKIHLETRDNPWRANISPDNRPEWFKRYGDVLVHYGQIGKQYNVDIIALGQEMINVAADNIHAQNTPGWIGMIERVRAVYNGKLTYGAHGNGNEDYQVKFWQYLDMIGSGPYYMLTADENNSVASLMASWASWDSSDIKPLSQQYNKPYLFIEIGYRNIPNSHIDPWNYARVGPSDEPEQARNYEALLKYWESKSHFAGVVWWDWHINPNSGGPNDTTFTPQNKMAENVLKVYWTGAQYQLKVTAPNGGELLAMNTTKNITWNDTAAAPDRYIVYAIQNFQNKGLIGVTDGNTKQLSWTVGKLATNPATFLPPGQYQIQVCRGSTIVCDNSDTNFTIQDQSSQPAPLITSHIPTKLSINTNVAIYWKGSASRYDIKLQGDTNAILAQNIPGENYPDQPYEGRLYSWQIGTGGAVVGKNYKLTICVAGTSACTSTPFFQVIDAGSGIPKTITAGNLPAEATLGSNLNITWTDSMTNNNRDNVGYNILLRHASTGVQKAIRWGVIQPGTGTKSYSWAVGSMHGVPDIPAGQYRVVICHDYIAPCTLSSLITIKAEATTNPQFTLQGSVSPANPPVNTTANLTLNITNKTGNTVNNTNVLVEVYDAAGQKVSQKVFNAQHFALNETKEIKHSFVPTKAQEYQVSVGVFNSSWSQLYTWGHHILKFTVGAVVTKPDFSFQGSVSPASPAANSPANLTIKVTNKNASPVSNANVLIEVYNQAGQKINEKVFSAQNFAASEVKELKHTFTPTLAQEHKVSVGVFNANWTELYTWGTHILKFTVGSSTPTAQVQNWWPTDGATVQGTQPFKAAVSNMNINDYQMYWQVDGGTLVQMSNSTGTAEPPHKVSLVNVSTWTWRGAGPYTITFIAKNTAGVTLGSKSIKVNVAP